MKNLKKLLAVALSATMLPVAMPMTNAAEESVAKNGYLFVEDFEGYAVGTISKVNGVAADANGKVIPEFAYSTVGTDYMEIAQDSTGNKYLKIHTAKTAAAPTSRTNARFEFAENYASGIKEFSFDFLPEAHASSFRELGVLVPDIKNWWNAPIYQIQTQGESVVNKKNEAIFGWASEAKTSSYGGKFGKVTQTVNFESAENNYKLVMKYGSATKTATKTVSLSGKTVQGMLWDWGLQYENGKAEVIDGYAVYSIDNVTVKDIKLNLESTNIADNGEIRTNKDFVLTFSEDISEGAVTLKKDGAVMAENEYIVTLSGKNLSVKPVNGWEEGAKYEVVVGEVKAASGIPSFSGATYTVVGSDLLFKEDFEGYAVGKLSKSNGAVVDANGKVISEFAYSTIGTDYMEIAQDSTGNKYLKIHTAQTSTAQPSSRTNARFEFAEKYNSGVKEVAFDFLPEAHASSFKALGSLVTNNASWYDSQIFTIQTQGSSVVSKLNEAVFGWASEVATDNYGGKFGKVTQTVNFESAENNYKLVMQYGSKTKTATKTLTTQGKEIQGVVWDMCKMYQNGSSTPIDGYAVYSVDNLIVKDLKLKLENASVANNGTISSNDDFVLTFNEVISNTDVTVKKNGVAMADSEYAVTVSGNTLSVKTVNGWEDGVKYEIIVGEVSATSGISAWGGQTFNVTGLNCLFVEDFEGYELGVIAEGPAGTVNTTRNPGKLNYSLLEGDKLEIVEKDGSKVLKLTVGNTHTSSNGNGGSRVIFDFDQHYRNGAYDVGFDFYVENHSAWFTEFGTIYDDTLNTAWVHNSYYSPIKRAASYINNLIDGWKAGGNYISSIEPFSSKDGLWKNLSSRIDFTVTPKPLAISVKKGEEESNWSTTVTGTHGHTTTKAVSALAWTFMDRYYGMEGSDEGLGVYYIDNIMVKNLALSYVGANVSENEENVKLTKEIELEFSDVIGNADNLVVKENGVLLSKDVDYSMTIDGRFITLKSLKDGWTAGTEYTIETGAVAGSSDAVQKFSGETLKFKTVAADTSSPAIIWSSIPNGATKVDSANNEIIIRTSGQELKTVSNENVVVKKDGIVVSDYTVSNFGRYGIIISDISLEKGAEYTVSVSGLVNKNGEAVQQGTYTITFNVRDDIYVDAQKYVITKDDAEGKTAKVMAELWNETEGDINYKVIGALKDNAGKILSVDYGTEGTLTAGDFDDVEVEVTLVEGADNYTLYIWDGIGTMKPLTDKISFEDADRTYGYDNYVNNEPLTIGFIGGSITNQGNYTTPLKKYLNEILDADARGGITYIDNQKSGVGGTGSDLGVYRIEKDIIKYNPDIVFIEFAVNDGYKADATEAVKNERLADIENLVRQLMELPHQPMVIMLDLTTKSLQENRPVIDDAENFRSVYGIENVDVAKYLWDNTKTEENPDGRFVWSNADVTDGEIALTDNDAVHPNAAGGKIYADYMNEVLAANPEKFFKKMNTVENAITESNYSNPRMISWREAEYNAYWKETKDFSHHMTDGQILPLEGAEVSFKFTGSTIGLYRVSGNPDDMAGTMEYSIDGGDWVTVSAYENLNYWRANKVIFSRSLDEDKEHTITLRAKNVDEKRFGFGYFIVD